MADEPPGTAELERIRQLALELAELDQGPAGELACALAEAVIGIAGQVDQMWRLITAAVQAAGLARGEAGQPPAEFVQALTSPRGSGHAGVRMSLSGREWVAAISHDHPRADPATAWAALERIARTAQEQDQDPQ
jgi:hypothetical protein